MRGIFGLESPTATSPARAGAGRQARAVGSAAVSQGVGDQLGDDQDHGVGVLRVDGRLPEGFQRDD